MALIDEVQAILNRLADHGWRELFAVHGFDIDASDLAAEVLRSLETINRGQDGFEDFAASATQAIEPGRPSHSLLYHALASPNVHPTGDGQPSSNPESYPTLSELDMLENFIYSLVADRNDLDDTFVAVFAYQYRVASRTSHLRHADMAYSRTGVARVGTAGPNYDRSRRSFWVLPEDGTNAIAVLPARYGAFLARRAKPRATGSVQGGHDRLANEEYIFPLHKLFPGSECLDGHTVSLDYLEFHRNEKLRMTHLLPESDGGLTVPAGFDISKEPYVRDSTNGGNLASRQDVGSSVLILPTPGATLVRTVSQRNSVTNREQIVHFRVPEARTIDRRGRRKPRNRIVSSSLQIPAFGRDRRAPEYVGMRHQVDPDGPVNQTLTRLSNLPDQEYDQLMKDGTYAAAHFTDDSADGCVEAIVAGLPTAIQSRRSMLAFSLVTAPDFFPLADQVEVETDRTITGVEPLSKGRLPVNPFLPRPSAPQDVAFDRRDKTVTAIVGDFALGPMTSVVGHPNRMVSFLPDGASNVFAPGWDTSRSTDGRTAYLTSSGLGSPFPEDAKLCAAIASFWPAVAPDNGRTFGNDRDPEKIDIFLGNQLPMLDEELGFHPAHQRVASGELRPYAGWDGEFGPFFEHANGNLYVNYVAIERSDYINHTLDGLIGLSLTAAVQSEELIARHQALLASERVLQPGRQSVVCLVVFRKVDDWAAFGRGSAELGGGGYLLEFGELKGDRIATDELNRVRKEVRAHHVCQVGQNGVAYRNGDMSFVFHPA